MSTLPTDKLNTRSVAAIEERDLDVALAEARADEVAGRYITESAQAHIARLEELLRASQD